MPVELHCTLSSHIPVQEPAYRGQDLMHGLTCRPQLLDMADGTQQCDLEKEQVILVVCSTQVHILRPYFSSSLQQTAHDQQFAQHILHEQFGLYGKEPEIFMSWTIHHVAAYAHTDVCPIFRVKLAQNGAWIGSPTLE